MSKGIRELKEEAQGVLLKGRHKKALEIFERVVELAGGDVFALKKIAEIHDILGEKEQAAGRYVQLSSVFEKEGRRLQAIACCKLALGASPGHAAAKALLERLYQESGPPQPVVQINPGALTSDPVAPPHPGTGPKAAAPVAQMIAAEAAPPETVAVPDRISPEAARDAGLFVAAMTGLCASFSRTTLSVRPQALAESISGQTDFLWVLQFAGAAEYTVVVSAQRRFVMGLTQRVLDVEERLITDAMATKLSTKLVSMYADDVKRAFAASGRAVQSVPPIPVTGENATYQLSGTRALHVPLSSEIGWVQITLAGGLLP